MQPRDLFLNCSASAGMEARLKATQFDLEKSNEKVANLERLSTEQQETIETLQVSHWPSNLQEAYGYLRIFSDTEAAELLYRALLLLNGHYDPGSYTKLLSLRCAK